MPGDASFRSTEGFKAPVKGLYSVKRIPLEVEAAVISGIICANDALPSLTTSSQSLRVVKAESHRKN